MGARGLPDNDQPTVDLGPRPPTEPDVFDDDPLPTVAAEVHGLPTQQLPQRPSQQPVASSSLTRASASATTTSPVEAMRHDEIERTRVFARVAIAISIGGIAIALTTTAGDPVARAVVLAGSVLSIIGSLGVAWVARDPATYSIRKLLPFTLPICFGSLAGVYYWGAASPVSAMLVYGIYFFSLSSHARITFFIYAIVSVAHLALGLGIILGAIEDRGIVSMGGLRTVDQVAIIIIIEAFYFIAYFTARASQRVTFDAMSKLEQAVRNVSQRDAMLAEARAELDRALKIGGPGRFTEQQVGSFKLGVLIGRGGMGEVYEARAVDGQREAAVKLLHAGTLADPTHVQRFLREAETAARLDCPNVVRVLEVGTTAAQIPFLAMERLRGTDLAHQLRRHRKIQLPQARVLADQVSTGLEAARAAGIVHRDLKPHNVFLAEAEGERRWKILDFGVSKAGGSGTLTKGHVVGTPAYMAPEQARGEDVDHRADVYSLAAILYRSITGHPAFTGKDVPSTLYDVVYRVPTQPSLLASLGTDVDRVLAMGLAKNPRDRFETAIELARWFAAAVEQRLHPDQRRRADDLIAKFPWGTRPGFT